MGEFESVAADAAFISSYDFGIGAASDSPDAFLSLGYDLTEALQRLRIAKSSLGEEVGVADLVKAVVMGE